MLDITMEFKKGILFVRLKGIINGDTTQILNDNLTNIVKENGIKYLLINFYGVDYIDKYGLNAIKDNYKIINENKGKMIICGLDNNNVTYKDNLYQINEERNAFKIISL